MFRIKILTINMKLDLGSKRSSPRNGLSTPYIVLFGTGWGGVVG